MSKTTRPKALIVSMYNYLVVIYEDISNYDPSVKRGPDRGSSFLHNIPVTNTRPRALLFDM